MTYTVTIDNVLLFDSAAANDGTVIIDPVLSLELGKIGTFTFTIYPQNTMYDQIFKLKSIVRVYDDTTELFVGRVLSDSLGWYNERTVVCESLLSYLNDSVVAPYEFPLTSTETDVVDYLRFLLAEHNKQMPEHKRIVLGTCNISDANGVITRSDSDYKHTLDIINDKIVDSYGGYLVIREQNGLVLDYVSDFDVLGSQSVELGKNLLTITTTNDYSDVATAIIPIGAETENGTRIDITGQPDDDTTDFVKRGNMIFSVSAENRLGGRIVEVVTWDDVTLSQNLLRKGREMLGALIGAPQTTTISAADLSAAGYNVGSFHIGTKINVVDDAHADAHGLESVYLVKAVTIPLLDPAGFVLTVGSTKKGFTESNHNTQQKIYTKIETDVTNAKTIVRQDILEQQKVELAASENSIMSAVSENYYRKGDVDTLIGNTMTAVEQTASAINVSFRQMQTDIENRTQATDSQFAMFERFIRFEDGNIIIGEVGNELTLHIENDVIQFLDGGTPVAYFSDSKLYVTNAEILTQLRIGNFAFVPRSNGNLSFRKVAN